jgi:hypothetical protein
MQYTGVEIIVARYQENVRWLESIPYELYDRMTIYNKGDDIDIHCKNLQVIKLQNVGRDIHSFLFHITQRYHCLAPITVFLHGSSYEVPKDRIYKELMKKLAAGQKNFCYVTKSIDKDLENFRILKWRSTNILNHLANPNTELTPSSIFPYGTWYRHYFGPCVVLPTPSYQSQFFVSKENIQKRPMDFYEQFLRELENSDRPELAHFLERAWPTLLHIPADYILDLSPA